VRCEFVVDRGTVSDGTALRTCLRFVEPRASTFECDLPVESDYPAEVARAAGTLSDVALRSDRRPPATGVLATGDPHVWDAFVTFAPYALDGSVWSGDRSGPIVSFADLGESIVVRLDVEEARSLAELLAPARLVPVEEWQRAVPRSP
jgi:hypothetical protein